MGRFMRVVIPAYRKPEQLTTTTLAWLDACRWAPELTLILLPDERDECAHRAVVPRKWHASMRVTCPGLAASRQVAQETLLDEGEPAAWLNDDVRGLVRASGVKETYAVSLQEVAENGWLLCERTGAHLWGTYATANPYFMKPGVVRYDLRHIVGSFFGTVNRRDPALRIRYGDAKEDYERSLRYWFRDGALVRFDDIAPLTRYYNRDRGEPIGGRFADRTPERVAENVLALRAEFGDLVRENPRRSGPWPEILLGERARARVPA